MNKISINEEILKLIRREKLDDILPQVMRDNNIDMWIQVIRPWTPDPLSFEFGSNSGVFIFTNCGSNRIERAVFDSELQNPAVYDTIVGEVLPPNPFGNAFINGIPVEQPGGPETDLDSRFRDLGKFVAKREPKSIGVNYPKKSKWGNGLEGMPFKDGLSYTDYCLLARALGDKYAKRMVPTEYLITDYLSRRVKKEIEFFHKFSLQRRLL